jgi:hypothetical protein
LVDKTTLDVDTPRIGTDKISDKPFARGRILKGMDAQGREQRIDPSPKSSSLYLLFRKQALFRFRLDTAQHTGYYYYQLLY